MNTLYYKYHPWHKDLNQKPHVYDFHTANAVARAEKSHEAIKSLGNAAESIGKVTGTITEISEQTNLPALNVTIDGIQSQTIETVVDIEEVTKIISEVNDIVTSIVTAVEEQAVTTNEIARNVSQASKYTGVRKEPQPHKGILN